LKITDNTVGSNSNNTNNLICNATNGDTENSNTTIFNTFTTDAIVSTTTYESSNWTVITSTASDILNTTINNTNSSDYASNRSLAVYPVILSSVAGGLLGLCIIVCIVGLLLTKKLHKRKTDNTLESFDSLFNRYIFNQLISLYASSQYDIIDANSYKHNKLLFVDTQDELTLGEGSYSRYQNYSYSCEIGNVLLWSQGHNYYYFCFCI